MPNYGSPLARRLSAGAMSTPPVFRVYSDPVPFFRGGGLAPSGGESFGFCTAGTCPSCEPAPSDSGGGNPTGGSPAPTPSPSTEPLDDVLDYAMSEVQGRYGEAAGGSLIDPARGNLMLQYATPPGGPLDPVILLTFNEAYRGNSDEYPDGWTSNFKRRIDNTPTPDLDVVSGSGTAYRYTPGAIPPDYNAPDTTPNWLADDLSNNGWIETQPDGLRYFYDSGGKLTKIQNHLGKTWTLTYVSGTSRVSHIENPASKRTTFLYDGSNKLQAIQDFAGRRTTLTTATVGALTQLTKITSPELCETEFTYDGNARVQVAISPGGSRTTYAYDGSGRVQNVTFADGGKTTYSYSGNDTIFTNPRGKVSTFQHSAAKLLETIIDPLGKRTTLTWSGILLRTVKNPLGKVTTFTSKTFASYGTKLLEAIESPTADLGTITYDSTLPADGIPPRVSLVEYPNLKKTTLHWAASTNLKVAAVEDPLNHRSSFSYDATGMLTASGDALANTFTYQYDTQSRLEATIDPLSKRTTYTYTANNQLETVKNPLGNVWTFTRDNLNRVTTAIDPLGNRTTSTYASNCLLQTVKNPLGNVTTYQYTSRNQLQVVIDPLGNRTTNTYDLAGNLESLTNPLGKITTQVYDNAGRLEATVNPLGKRTTYTYDDAGRLIEVKNPLGNISTTVYDDDGRVLASVNPEGERTTNTYDANGRLTEVKDALGNVTTSVYDAAGRLTATVNALGKRTSFTYDDANRQIELKNALGKVSTTVYDAVGRVSATVNALGKRTTFHYDAAGQQESVENPLNKRTTTTYNAAGRPTEVRDPLGNRTTSVYDAAGQVTATVNPLAKRTTTTYDAAGRATEVRDPNNRRVTTVYDAASQVTATINQLGKRTTFTYDDAGQRTVIQDARTNRTTFQYDDAGRLEVEIDQLARRLTHVYDKVGRQTVRVDQKNRRTTYVYDDVGQPTSREYQDTTRVTQTYDAVGQRTVLWDSTGRTTTTYDDIGQVTSVKNPANKTITYTYYDDGLRNVTTEPGGGLFTYTYDDASRMTLIKNPQNDLTTFEYDDAGRRTAIRRQNGARTSLIYDNASQLTQVVHRNSGGTTITSYDYTYDNAGVRTQVVENGPVTVVWGYDNAYRLTSERRNNAGGLLYADTFTYDDVGNRTLLHNASGRTTYTYDVANQLETAVVNTTRTTYTYDANGNLQVELTGTNRTTNTWDDENRLTQVQFPGGSPTTNQYTFNGDGQRVQIVDSQGTKKPIWDFQNILLETDGSNVTQVVYTLEPAGYGNLISQRRSTTSTYYLFDVLGSARKLTNSASTVTDSYDFRAYGETFASSVTTVNVFRWIGELGYYYDVDRLAYYLRARPYDPRLTRFLGIDPLRSKARSSHGYSYSRNAPPVFRDPSGKISRPIHPPTHVRPAGWAGGINVINPADCRPRKRATTIAAIVRYATQSACDCIADALDLLKSCPDAVAEQYESSVINQHWLGTWIGQSVIRDHLACAAETCSNPIKFECECSQTGSCRPGETAAYVNYYFGIPADRIHLCPLFFGSPDYQQWKDIAHEIGRLCGIGDTGTGTNMDIDVFDKALHYLCRDSQIIREKCAEGTAKPLKPPPPPDFFAPFPVGGACTQFCVKPAWNVICLSIQACVLRT